METLAAEKKEDQGHHECEVLPGGICEAQESSYAWRNCSKNPGHANFIPAREISITDLPKQCQKLVVLEHVRCMVARTVKLRVGYVSTARPDGYCFSQFRGEYIPHFGTGTVDKIIRTMTGPCLCPQCKHNPSPSQTWYKITVSTAHHVVYNSEEARATRVDLFFDYENSEKDGRMKIMWGDIVSASSSHQDICVLTCVTHDETIIHQLKLAHDHIGRAISAFHNVTDTAGKEMLTSALKQLCVIVSHPHGQPKKVTFGENIHGKQASMVSSFHYVYTTDTCPGSSGAFVMVDDHLLGHLPSGILCEGIAAVHSIGGAEGRLNRSGPVAIGRQLHDVMNGLCRTLTRRKRHSPYYR